MKTLNIQKHKIIEILITALLSAGIAILQNILSSTLGNTNVTADPTVAGVVAISLRTVLPERIC